MDLWRGCGDCCLPHCAGGRWDCFPSFQIEINLTVIAALLTLVGFDVNDSIVIFDRIRENRKLYRRMNLYDVTNLSINQTLSRTVITSGLVFLFGSRDGAPGRRNAKTIFTGLADGYHLWHLRHDCSCRPDHGLVGKEDRSKQTRRRRPMRATPTLNQHAAQRGSGSERVTVSESHLKLHKSGNRRRVHGV